ncbi:MAG: GDP-mannose 4,6-dehydratase [Candidatus Electrothrix scaldis]|nr:MAG: GDP-mannose 4,6-dehydratase [Candidatus Electrothrix sp. GW3-3]
MRLAGDNKKILITGGAGFIGSNISILFKEKYPDTEIIALDNLKRRGSELNISRLKKKGIEFIHGDIRNKEDLSFEGSKIDAIIECSAEPSVLAGFGENPSYLLNTNLNGMLNCLELARTHRAKMIFLSTSRVYPFDMINYLSYSEDRTRFSLKKDQYVQGVSAQGISEDFSLNGYRSLYGATKLSAEFIALEYAYMYDVPVVVNRCGVIAGPWQMGKVDQGVFTFWMAAHYFKKKIRYISFGGTGKQVRDVLHFDDLFLLIDRQLHDIKHHSGNIYNVGGGIENSLSLLETTEICRELTGNTIEVISDSTSRPADIKYYVSDCAKVKSATGWVPKKKPDKILEEIWMWIKKNEKDLSFLFL